MEDIATFVVQLLLAILLGGLIGWQRERIGKAAGLRTFALVCLGSTLFTLIALDGFGDAEASRIAAQIITGIGFIGAGTIIHNRHGGIEGLTTAAGLWAMAAVGMAIGVGWHWQAMVATLMMFILLLFPEKKYLQK